MSRLNSDSQISGNIMVGMPLYNEEETVGSMVHLAKKYTEIVVCLDDGSSDNSGRIAKKCGAEVHSHRVNRGYGGALKTLFAIAKQKDVDVLVVMDSDGQHNPNDIPKMVEPIFSGDADMVIGSRFISREGETEMPSYRKLGIKVITTASNLSSNLNITDTQSGFRAFSREALKKLRFESEGMELSIEMLDDADEKNIIVKEVPTKMRYDVPKGSNFTAISHGFTVFSYALISLSQKKPILVLGIPGVGLLATGTALGLRAINGVSDYTNVTVGPGLTAAWVGVIGISLIFAGVMLQSARSILKRLILRDFSIE